MDKEHLEVLAEAVKIRQRKEELEKAIGRATRKAQKSFRFYIEVVNEVRDTSRARKVPLEEAARILLAKDQDGGDERDQQNDSGS